MVIAIGYFLRLKQFLSVNTVAEMNKLVFTFALPVMLFRNIYRADFEAVFDAGLMLWIIISISISFLLVWVIAEIYLRKQKDLISAFVQASLRANYAIVGLPIVANILGDRDTGQAALAAAFIVTLFNVYSVIVLTAKGAGTTGFNPGLVKSVAKSIATNPSIIGIILGVAFNLLNVPLPVIVSESVHYLAVLSTPLALLAVGGSIQIPDLMQYLKPAITACAMKIVVLPVIFVALSVWLGFRGEELVVLFVLFANPTAILSYVMAARMNGNAPITAAIILLTTAFSSVTITIGVYTLRIFELI